ncbi:MAG: alpha/beta hydrolase-fold protein [Candidatus Acidiferrales bacterium]
MTDFARIAIRSSLALVLLLLASPVQPVAAQAPAVAGFMAGAYRSSSGESMVYRLFVPPDYDAAKSYPLVLWLHGAAGRGSDNFSQLSGGNFAGSHLWTTPANQAKYHAFVLAPQVDVTKGWARPHTNTPPVAIRLALEILDTIEKRYSIDRSREYVAGQSMGGEGVWAALSIAPQRFAAAIALSGYGDAYMIPRVARVPVWIFQGEEDPLVPVTRARHWVAQLRQAGGTPKYTEYPGIGHNAWDVAFDEPGLAEWLFSHTAALAKGE